jgi:putative glutamine amidotransferase
MRKEHMLAKKRPVIALDIKLKHYFDPETDKVVGVDRYETDFSYRDRYQILNRYVDAIQERGGLPLLIPPVTDEGVLAAYLDMADGFLCVGLNDYPPAMYREPKLQAVVQDTEGYRRHAESNMILARMVLEELRMPTVGICAGPQLYNIVLGGKLVQHIDPGEGHIAHNPTRDKYHDVEIRGGRILAGLFGKTRISVNTNHHQAPDPEFLGTGLEATAYADDGVVEAVEAIDDRFVLGVQWHPERIRDTEHSRKIFGAFIEAAQEYREKKT